MCSWLLTKGYQQKNNFNNIRDCVDGRLRKETGTSPKQGSQENWEESTGY